MTEQKRNVMIVGAGWTGSMFIEKIQREDHPAYCIKCVIDDDKEKLHTFVHGVEIVGSRAEIIEKSIEYEIDDIVVALPSVNKCEVRKILDICKQTGCRLKSVPNIYEIDDREIEITRLRSINIEDLLEREPIKLNNDIAKQYIQGMTVLITGAGGSIGSELAKQVALNEPKRLILLDIYENTLFELEQELMSDYNDIPIECVIANVRDEERIHNVFKMYKPDVVYHAAAHKHVPLMESNPNEAIENNVFGTYTIAKAAGEHNIKKFILISTDKAVNPTNIMGASKRICEMIVQMLDGKYQTTFGAVRFGNVLGSNGSVVPLFKKQIMRGGPIKVTHPDIIRYFMTISEAVSLVLQAGTYANGGEIFVLDMGEPVKILDLAKNMIRLAGYSENEIEIQFVGLRPGEKLYEELLMSEEGLKKTENKLIYIGQSIEFDEALFVSDLEELRKIVSRDGEGAVELVKKMVPTYQQSMR